MAAAARVKRPKRMRRLQHPDRQAARYSCNLKRFTADMFSFSVEAMKEIVKPMIPGAIVHDADPVGRARDKAEERLNKKWTRKKIAEIVNITAEDVERFHRGQFRQQMEAIVSIDVIGSEPWLVPDIERFTNDNVTLIKSISSRYFHEIETTIKEDVANGLRWEEMADDLEDRYGVSKSRAELIARDQTGKFYGELNAQRQAELGIESFIWRTANDERVREEHAALDGEVFKWSAPPSEGIPGEPIQCRCYADPVIEGFADD
jgi:SPP1 gp7 family putative phage head morphogenesis protein